MATASSTLSHFVASVLLRLRPCSSNYSLLSYCEGGAFFKMLKRNRSSEKVPIIYLFVWVGLVCLFFHVWKSLGCIGISNCYLCKDFTPDTVRNTMTESSSGDDFRQLIDLKNFTFLMNNHVCNNTDLLLLVLVHSDPYNYEKRLTIRSTWGNVTSDKYKLLFLMGIPNNTVIQNRIVKESSLNGDLVQGNFRDAYRNLTYKHVMAFKWAKYFCPNARYILKTDDDVFVNLPGFLHNLDRMFPEKNLMRCDPVYEALAQRTFRSKWRVSWSEYQYRHYPPFCQGYGILYTPDVVLTLYEKAQTAKYFWIDDVFITGLLAMSANVVPSTFGSYILEHSAFHRLMNEDCKNFSYLLGPWNLDVRDVRNLWEKAFKAGLDRDLGEVKS